MNVAEAARSAWRDVWANKVRSALSFSAISVGVASLLYTLAQTKGMQQQLQKNVELMGPGAITIEKDGQYVSKGLSPGLTLSDAGALKSELPDLYMVDPRLTVYPQELVAAGQRVPYPRVDGVSQEWRKRDWVYTLDGRFIDGRDVKDSARVCVLLKPGGWLHKPFWAEYWHFEDPLGDLISHRDLLGKTVRLQDTVFFVVGILRLPPRDVDPRWESWDNPNVLVPVTAAQRYLRDGGDALDRIDSIRIDTGDEKTLDQSRRRIDAILTLRHRGEKDFKLRDMRSEMAGRMDEMKKYIAAALILGIVALLAGGIGIMNVTLATIFSRVKEIGIRRALGASRGDILAQFLCEAALLGVAGGVAGIGLGKVGLHFLESWNERQVAHLTWYHCCGMVLVGAAVSALFAALPAYQASGMEPVEALRSE